MTQRFEGVNTKKLIEVTDITLQFDGKLAVHFSVAPDLSDEESSGERRLGETRWLEEL